MLFGKILLQNSTIGLYLKGTKLSVQYKHNLYYQYTKIYILLVSIIIKVSFDTNLSTHGICYC